jgi:hypothetical protein
MPKWLKIVLILLGVVVLLCGLSSAGAYWWLNANKDRLKGVGERAKKEGNAFAYEHDAEECVDEGLRRLKERSSIVDQAEHKLFLKACLEKASRPAGFCTGAPPHGEIFQAANWAVERCVAKGRPQDQDCGRLMQAALESCQRP